ncbi:MAG: CatB-related O-acetyltransferase [Pedobacter sp.]|nr:MAG: CatB-related O-acetyltransferase [Pedobacter sp.]
MTSIFGLLIEKIKNKAYQRVPKRILTGTANNIESEYISTKSIIGHNITILKNTHISEDSTIDSYTHIGYNTLITKSTIGRYNSIASNVNIGHGEHPINDISTNMLFFEEPYSILTEKQCCIEHDVWIGVNSTIRRGVNIGIGAIIGANSFVNKNVPAYAIVVGSPAKIIRYRFEKTKIEKILESQWWLKDLEEARKIVNRLKDEP